jgi:ribosome-associated protein
MQSEVTNELKDASSIEVCQEIVRVLLSKKGIDVRMYDVREDSPITDFYVNVTGRATTQVAALADEVVYQLGLKGVNALRVEGRQANSWLLVDFGDVILNVFDPASRKFYDLDRHFSAEKAVDISELETQVDSMFIIGEK